MDTYACTIIANRTPKLWDIKRKLSVREAARLQGFPDSFNFPVSNNQAYKQLGNSVVVSVIKAIGKEMIKSYFSGVIRIDLFSNIQTNSELEIQRINKTQHVGNL